MDTIFLTKNPEEKIPKRPEISLLENLRKDQIEQKQGGRNTKILFTDTAKLNIDIAEAVEYPVGTGGSGFYVSANDWNTNQIAFSPVSTNLRKVQNVSAFNFNVSVNMNQTIWTITSVPSSDFSVPVFLSGFYTNSNYWYNALVDAKTGEYSLEEIFSINLGVLEYNKANDVFRFVPYKKSFNLLDTLASRPLLLDGGDVKYFDFNSDEGKITEDQLNNFLNGNYPNINFDISTDLTSLAVANFNFMFNDILGNNVLKFVASLDFEYIGILANF